MGGDQDQKRETNDGFEHDSTFTDVAREKTIKGMLCCDENRQIAIHSSASSFSPGIIIETICLFFSVDLHFFFKTAVFDSVSLSSRAQWDINDGGSSKLSFVSYEVKEMIETKS